MRFSKARFVEVTALVARGQRHDGLPYSVQVGAQGDENLSSDTFALSDKSQQDVLGPDVVVPELHRLTEGELEDLLSARRERRRTGRARRRRPDRLLDLRPNGHRGDTERLEHPSCHCLVLSNEPEQKVFGADEAVIQRQGFFSGLDQHPSRPVREPLEH